MCLALPGDVASGSKERVSVPEGPGKEALVLINCPVGEGRKNSYALQDTNAPVKLNACWVGRRCICSSTGEMLVPWVH